MAPNVTAKPKVKMTIKSETNATTAPDMTFANAPMPAALAALGRSVRHTKKSTKPMRGNKKPKIPYNTGCRVSVVTGGGVGVP